MILYHGGNIEVRQPRLLNQQRPTDFGSGFYLTSDLEQASHWAVRVTKRRQTGTPTVSAFNVDISQWNLLKIRSFQMDEDWLEYVFDNRHLKSIENDWDVVFGPVADDQTMTTLGLYLSGQIKAHMAIEMLLPQKLKDQYCFKTEAALNCLHFMEVLR